MNLHVFSVASLATWVPQCGSPPRDVLVVPVEERSANVVVERIVRRLTGRAVRVAIQSGHDTLGRDLEIAARLREQGHDVFVQSETCVRLGTDKTEMKRFFEREGIPTLPWSCPGHPASDPTIPVGFDGPIVVKKRDGTAGQGQRLAERHEPHLGGDEYVEPFVHGEEYSVNVFRDERETVILPLVWKGATRLDLLPPFRRLRLCPAPFVNRARESRMLALAERIAELSDCRGFLEVELLETEDGTLWVLEINPRISGTLRLATLASNVPPLDLVEGKGTSRYRPAVDCVVELPYEGPPISDVAGGIFATTRATATGADFGAAAAKLSSIPGVSISAGNLVLLVGADIALRECIGRAPATIRRCVA